MIFSIAVCKKGVIKSQGTWVGAFTLFPDSRDTETGLFIYKNLMVPGTLYRVSNSLAFNNYNLLKNL